MSWWEMQVVECYTLPPHPAPTPIKMRARKQLLRESVYIYLQPLGRGGINEEF